MTLAVLLVCGFGFAGPAQAQQREQIIERGTISQPAVRADLGFRWFSRNMGRPVVSAVDPNSLAAKAGLAAGDTVMMVDGRSTQPMRRLFQDAVPGRKYVVQVKRGAESREFVIEAMAPAPTAQAPGSKP